LPRWLGIVRSLSHTTIGMQAAQLRSMPLHQSPRALTGMLAPKLLPRRRIATRRAPVTHRRQFGCREQLELTHTDIVPPPSRNTALNDHAEKAVNLTATDRTQSSTQSPRLESRFLEPTAEGFAADVDFVEDRALAGPEASDRRSGPHPDPRSRTLSCRRAGAPGRRELTTRALSPVGAS
jgi:hypothetical protein